MNLKNVLLDTDIGPDCDDVGALALLNIFADKGLCRILGIAHCTSNPYGAGTIDAINYYYGRPDLNIGTYYGKGFLDDENCMIYNKYITTKLPNRYRKEQPEEAVSMYRRILAAQEDDSVDFIAIGPLNNLSALLDSAADENSPLNGAALVEKKVRQLVLMAGAFEPSVEGISELSKKITGKDINEVAEYNVVCDIAAAQNVAENWPTPKRYVGWEAGLVETGKTLLSSVQEDHPVRLAYHLYTENGERFSWDLLTVEYAVNQNSAHYKLSEKGWVRFDEQGRTKWTPDERGQDCYVKWNQTGEKIAEDINKLLIIPPQN